MKVLGQKTTAGRVGKSAAKHATRTALAGSLAMVLLGATTGTAALQDIAEMTGTRTDVQGRWLARLVAVPQGSVHMPGKAGGAGSTLTHAMAVDTFEGRQLLDAAQQVSAGLPQSVIRGFKGDRLHTPQAEPVQIASIAPETLAIPAPMLNSAPIVAKAFEEAAVSSVKTPSVDNHLTRLAQAFRPSKGVDEETYENGVDKDPVRLSEDHLAEARAAAKMMHRVVDKMKKQDAVYSPTILAAYAPQEKDIASAFAAVLKPQSSRKIRLAKGDHKWAGKRLPASSKSRRQRRCLANGVYFEARGESLQGQRAVAQVIINRVKNPAYPNSICGVVYQNKQKRNACQFSFACDGIRDRVAAGRHWNQSQKVANDAIDGRFWLRSVGSSSHYHADYVAPRWRRSMERMVKIGRHIFYRTYGGGWS